MSPQHSQSLRSVKPLLTTQAVVPCDRMAYWVDMICSTYVRLECDPPAGARQGFRGLIEQQSRLPGMDVTVVRSCAQIVRRTRSAIAKDPEDCFIISAQTRGRGLISQDGRHAVLQAGDFCIYHSTQPYTLEFDREFEEVVLKVPGDALRALVRDAESLTATSVTGRGVPGRLFQSMLRTLRQETAPLPPASASLIGQSLLNTIAAGLQTIRSTAVPEPSALKAYHLERVRRCIEENLADPNLTIEGVAHRVGLSTAHLHRLYAVEPYSASKYLWRRRLEQCSRDLLDTALVGRSISEIGYRWGFNDAAHFSRAFREHFGCSPRQWRSSAGNAD